MRSTFHLGLDDYYDAAQARNAKNRRIANSAVLLIILLLGLVWFRTPTPKGGHPVSALVLASLLLIGVMRATSWLGKLYFERSFDSAANHETSKVYTVDISEDGIELLDPPQKDEWSSFSKYSESDRSFILYQGASVCAILPKRSLGPQDVDQIRRILGARLSKH
jgi:hypothetical protein